jgi:hypothetical protein
VCSSILFLQFDFCCQERETLVAFCVQQHHSLKFELCCQERENVVDFCVHQHHLLNMNFVIRKKRFTMFFCAATFVSKSPAFFSGGRDSGHFCSASALFS